MAKYRKKPVIVDAFKWTGGQAQTEDPEWMIEALKKQFPSEGSAVIMDTGTKNVCMKIYRSNLNEWVYSGDYIIRNEDGALSSCLSDNFKASYELVS